MQTLFALALVVAPVAAAPASGSIPIELTWDAPASCPQSDDIERDVRRILADARIPDAVPPIVVRVSLQPGADGGFALVMRTTMTGVERERELHTETCEEARALVAFLLALLVDPNARQPPAETSPAAAPVEAPPPAPERRQAPAREASRDLQQGARLVASLSGGAEFGMLPAGSAGGELRMGLLLPGWSVEGRGAAWLPRSAESPAVAGSGGDFRLLETGLLGCGRWAASAGLSVQPCAGLALLFLQGTGFGVRTPDRASAVFGAATAEVGLALAISKNSALRSAIGALAPFRRPTFAIREVGSIHRPSAFAARASLGLELRF